MNNLLVLTIGTGTAGAYSNLAAGMSRSVELLQPRKFWLVPSTDPVSLAIAELVAEAQPAYAGTMPLENPDDLECCRNHIRNIICKVRQNLKDGERLIINPTSGTKQMTAAATLAALDEQVGDIVFTTGERVDGVVKTGTEKITTFNADTYFQERDLALAREFFSSGNFSAAERILKPHNKVLTKEWGNAYTCLHWRRLDYDLAKAYANHLSNRQTLEIVADVLAWSKHAIDKGDSERSMHLTYKALELAGRYYVMSELALKPDKDGRYKTSEVAKVSRSFKPDPGRTMALGLMNIVRLLGDHKHPFGYKFCRQLEELTTVRHETTHAIRPVDLAEPQKYLKLAIDLLQIEPTEIPDAL